MLTATVFVSSMNIGPCFIKGNAASDNSKRVFEKLDFEIIKER